MPYGWYSKTFDEQWGHLIYSKSDGSTTKVTMVTSTNTQHSKWKDIVSCGEIKQLIENRCRLDIYSLDIKDKSPIRTQLQILFEKELDERLDLK